MPHSKFIVISSGLMKCTCGQMIKYETEREEKMKLKVSANPLEGWDDSWPSSKRRTLEESERYPNDQHNTI